MSASREKKTRQEQLANGYVDPKVKREQEEKAKNRRSNLLYGAVAVLFVIVAAVAIIANTGVLERNKDAVRIGDETYTAADLSYYYNTAYSSFVSNNYYYLSYYGLDTSSPLDEQSCLFGEDMTWHDYFMNQAIENLRAYSLLAQEAEKNGFDGDEYVESSLEATLADLDTYASQNGYTRSQYLSAYFGSLVNEKVFTRNVRLMALAEAYSMDYASSLEFTEEDVNAEYEANPQSYQSADIEYIIFSETPDDEATDEEAEALLNAQKELAETAIERYNNGESLEEIAEDMEGAYTHRANAGYGTSDLLTWAFDDARADGDSTITTYSTTGYYAAVFHSRSRNDYHAVSVRHILVETEDEANELLDKFNAGEKTEEAFAVLANENSTDSGSNTNGGLYTNIYKGQMVEPFEEWCFDASRKTGDTGIVESSNGFHVMYFVETSEQPYWYYSADLALQNNAYSEWYDGIVDAVEAEQLDGIKYVG